MAVIPTLRKGLLPPGVYTAELAEIEAVFGFNDHRRRLLRGFRRGALALKAAGCRTVWLDGSFTTSKEKPDDYDACWDTSGVDRGLVDPILLIFDDDRLLQKVKYGGEFFPNIIEVGCGLLFKDFFQIDKSTGCRKGIIEVDLRRLQ